MHGAVLDCHCRGAGVSGHETGAALHENAHPSPLRASVDRYRGLISCDDIAYCSCRILIVDADQVRHSAGGETVVPGTIDRQIRDGDRPRRVMHVDLRGDRVGGCEADRVGDDPAGWRRHDGLIQSTRRNSLQRKTLVDGDLFRIRPGANIYRGSGGNGVYRGLDGRERRDLRMFRRRRLRRWRTSPRSSPKPAPIPILSLCRICSSWSRSP